MITSGIKMQAAKSMMPSERWLEELSQIVKLESGIVLDGMMNGNRLAPAVLITPITARQEEMNAGRVLRNKSIAAALTAPKTPKIGSVQSSGC